MNQFQVSHSLRGTTILLALLGVVSCGGAKEAPAPVDESDTVATEVRLALAVDEAIQAAPAAADSVLKANGLTRSSFDALHYRIAEDSTRSAQYSAGRR